MRKIRLPKNKGRKIANDWNPTAALVFEHIIRFINKTIRFS